MDNNQENFNNVFNPVMLDENSNNNSGVETTNYNPFGDGVMEPITNPVESAPIASEPEFIFPTENVINPVPVEPVSMESEKIENNNMNESFTEMPFQGVNQEEKIGHEVNITNRFEQTNEVNTNMSQIVKEEDENAGLKFLLVIGIILAIVVILLPIIAL